MSFVRRTHVPMKAIRQIGSFGLVGVAATLIHAAVFSGSTTFLNIEPQLANVSAFLCALPVSYAFNMRLTFGRRPRLGRFFVAALAGYGLNAANVLAVQTLTLPPIWAVPGMILVVPALLFLLSKFWVYRPT